MAIVFQPLYQDDRGNHAELMIDDAALVCTGVRVTVAANAMPLSLSCTIAGVDYQIEYAPGTTTITPFPAPLLVTLVAAGDPAPPLSRFPVAESTYAVAGFSAFGYTGGEL